MPEAVRADYSHIDIPCELCVRVHIRPASAALTAQYRLPAVYPIRFFATNWGLLSYGSDTVDSYRRAAPYANRILRGEKPSELPVQAPVKYELVVNLKTAKALGLE